MDVSEAVWMVEVVHIQPAHGEASHEVEDYDDIFEGVAVIL
jgi:hypothetical protein